VVLPVTVATLILLVLIIGRVFYRERLSAAAWIGCVLGALAVAALAYGGQEGSNGRRATIMANSV